MNDFIFKHQLKQSDEPQEIPAVGQVLRIGFQPGSNDPVLWATHNEESPSLEVCIRGTGMEVPNPEEWEHIGTAQESERYLVWHVFKRIAGKKG